MQIELIKIRFTLIKTLFTEISYNFVFNLARKFIIVTKLIVVLSLFISVQVYGNYTIAEKVALLYELAPNSNSQKAFTAELIVYCQSLEKFNKFPPKKRIKKIFALTKSTYLKYYKLNTFFPKIHQSGTYNCVTGTALFALIFDELKIPYSIVEIPQHVYLIAYPNSHKIAVESTELKDGIYYWTAFNKTQAISFLINIGNTTQNEVQLRGVDAVINEFFYSDNELNFDNLLGLYYFNRSLYFCDLKEYQKALFFAKKSNNFYKNERSDFLMGALLVDLIIETSYEDINLVAYLTQYYELATKKKDKERIIQTFNYAYQEALFTRHDFDFVDSTEVLIKLNLTLEKDQFIFLSSSLFQKARWKAIKGEYKSAFIDAEKGYKMNSSNFEYNGILAMLLVEKVFNINLNYNDLKDSLVFYENEYPFLEDNKRYLTFLTLVYSEQVYIAFSNNKAELGDQIFINLKDVLEKLNLTEESELIESKLAVNLAEMYGQMAAYYYRQKDFTTALKWIDMALFLDTDNESLLYKKRQIEKN